jgi:preprotein translocase subunit SecE
MAKEKTQATPGAPTDPQGDKPGKAKVIPAKAKGGEAAAGQKTGIVARIESAKEFFEQSKVELKKVTWPTRQETVKTGIAVLIFSVVMAIYLGVVDMVLSRLVAFILS